MKNTGLVLEGGGMRGVYTAGVLEFFLENELFFSYIIGVSAGAGIASTYLSRQKGRNKKVNVDYANHPEYISYKNWIRRRELFGMDFIFDKIPNQLVPFDFKTFHAAKEQFVVGTTDCVTGLPAYFEKHTYVNDFLTILRASSSLPFMAPIIQFGGKSLLDGGISDPIPIKKSEADVNGNNILILTRNEGYLKKKSHLKWLLKKKYAEYKGLIGAMENRFNVYNETIAHMEQQETAGNAFVIRPTQKLEVRRVERNPRKLMNLYNMGFKDAQRLYPKLEKWLKA